MLLDLYFTSNRHAERTRPKDQGFLPAQTAGFAGDLESILAGRRAWDEQCEPTIGPGVFREETTRPFYSLIHPAFGSSAILYAHGGGFTEGSARTHHHLCKAISKAAHACVYNVEYSLAPEAPYPVAVDEFCELYWRVREKHAAIYFAGDSAGAGLVMQAMLKLMRSGETEKINGIVLISPWLDLDVEKHKHSPRDGADPLVTYDALKGCAGLYLAGADATDPAISPSFAKGQPFPPTLILVGSDEILLDDALEFYENNKTTSQIELAVYEGMWHVWPGWLEMDESQRAIKQIGDFLNKTAKNERAVMSQSYHLAQLNIAKKKAPLEAPEMADFVKNLVRINTLAEQAPGFVWRLKDESGNATGVANPFGDEMIVNMSVWQSVDALREYAFKTAHTEIMRRRREWFERMDEAYAVLWWVAVGHEPTLHEAAERLAHLRQFGASEKAFTFKDIFPQPEL